MDEKSLGWHLVGTRDDGIPCLLPIKMRYTSIVHCNWLWALANLLHCSTTTAKTLFNYTHTHTEREGADSRRKLSTSKLIWPPGSFSFIWVNDAARCTICLRNTHTQQTLHIIAFLSLSLPLLRSSRFLFRLTQLTNMLTSGIRKSTNPHE